MKPAEAPKPAAEKQTHTFLYSLRIMKPPKGPKAAVQKQTQTFLYSKRNLKTASLQLKNGHINSYIA